MKQLKLTFLLTILMSMVGARASAHDFALANDYGTTIYYERTSDSEVAVSYEGSYGAQYSNEYVGNVVIPGTITYNGITYSVTSIGNSAFDGCSHLTSVEIPNSVTSIGGGAFEYCSGLTSITIPNSVTSIGGYAFAYCSGLTKITIPYRVTSIGDDAFKGCSGLTSIEIPNSVTSIGYDAFQNCSSLTSVTIPNSVTSINSGAFSGCSGLTSISVNSRNTRYDSRDNCEAIIETSSNTLIAGCKNTIVPNTVTSIGSFAFDGCSGLTSITIPNSVTSIGNCAFQGCSDLSNVISEIMNPFVLVSSSFNNTPVCTLTVPAATKEKYIEAGWTNSVFKGGIIDMSEPEIIIVSEGTCFTVKTIEGVEMRFMITDASLRNVQVGLASPKDYWVESKVAIDNNISGSLTIPEKVVYGGIEYSVTRIANAAFMKCSNLTNITIPESVTHIGHAAFDNCRGLTSIYIPNSVTSIDDGYAFYGCTNLASVHISENIKVLPNDTFSKCSSLTSVTIPEGVTDIGKGFGGLDGGEGDAFWDCSGLTTVIIPSTVTYFVGNSFWGCNKLATVMIRRAEPVSINKNTFPNRKYATLYVPEGSKTAYENANYWNEFNNIVERSGSFKCATPTINYKGGKLSFDCETEGVTYHYSITTPESEDNTGNDIAVASTYIIKAYASKEDYVDSDVATKEIDIRGLKGDVDGDGVVDVNDVQTTINIILKK